MTKSSLVSTVLCLSLFATLGCSTVNPPSTVSIETIEEEVSMSPITSGVSEGQYMNQQVVYVNSQQGADWLFESALQEYNALLERYSQTNDATLVPRMEQLQITLQLTGNGFSDPFLMTFASGAETVKNISCSGGGGTCTCADNCTCSASSGGCNCTCPAGGGGGGCGGATTDQSSLVQCQE
jgi:hypothetical protein